MNKKLSIQVYQNEVTLSYDVHIMRARILVYEIQARERIFYTLNILILLSYTKRRHFILTVVS